MERRTDLDLLKVIALLCIILAHVNPTDTIFQIRNFDVTLMMLISSYLAINSKKKYKFARYICRRLNRLVFPTWIFLTIFFIINFIFHLAPYSSNVVFTSYTFESGIGYVWIIRIYLIIALITPINLKIKEMFKNKAVYYFFVTLIYILYEILCHHGYFNNRFLYYAVAFIIPTYILLEISKIVFNYNKTKTLFTCVVSGVIYSLIGIYLYKTTGSYQSTQTMKYPFRLYYLSYGIFISCLLTLVIKKIPQKIMDSKIIKFISDNSLWIYLWHILIVHIVNKTMLTTNWSLKYIVIIIMSWMITKAQNIFLNKMKHS